MGPTRPFPIIVLLSLANVEYGGRARLGFLTGRGTPGAVRTQFFRAGHAHAGVLPVLPPAYLVCPGRAGYPTPVQWLAGSLPPAGGPAQPGGFFAHLGTGPEGRAPAGIARTRAGALPIAAALTILAIGPIKTG